MRRAAALLLSLLMLLTGCGSSQPAPEPQPAPPAAAEPEQREESDRQEPDKTEDTAPALQQETDNVVYAYIGETRLTIELEDNSSAEAFYELLEQGDLTVEKSDYGGFEKVGSLGTALPTNDSRITTSPGDVILYQGSSVTIYYGVNTWSFTRLGRVQSLTEQELKTVLDAGGADISVRFSVK